MAEFTFPSQQTTDTRAAVPIEDTAHGLLDKLRHLGDLYGPAGVVEAAKAIQSEIRIAGNAGLVYVAADINDHDPETFEADDVPRPPLPRLRYVAATLAAASTFCEELHLTVDSDEIPGALRELRDAIDQVLTLEHF